MPEAVLSAVVFLIGVDLIDDKGMRKIYNQRRSEFWVALITMLMVIFVFVEQGVVVAIVLSLIDHTRRGYHPTNMLLAPGESGIFKQNSLESHTQARPGLMIYRFTHSMYFANAQQLSEEVTTLVKHAEPPLRWFCIEASAVQTTLTLHLPKHWQSCGSSSRNMMCVWSARKLCCLSAIRV